MWLLPGASQAAQAVLVTDPEADARLERVQRLIEGFETPYGMELLATVHWVSQDDSHAAEAVAAAVAGVQRWNPRKRQIFQPYHIAAAWQRLHDEQWLPASSGA